MPPSAVDAVLDELAAIIGPSALLTGRDAEPYLTDWRGVFSGDALAVARPGSTDEAAEIVGACGTHGVAIVPQGGNSGLSGGAAPIVERPCVVLSTSRMSAIETVDPAGSTITVQAGCTVEAVQAAARDAGLSFAPDWGARGTATIGGAIATDAGGMNVLRYGRMRAHVLGVEVVLADGAIWDGLRALRKDATGYDLKQLFIGSEGTLGLVTRATLALEAARPHVQSALAALADLDSVLPLFAGLRRDAGDALVAFELVDELGMARTTERFGLPRPLDARADHYALVKLAAAEPVSERLARALDTAVADGLVRDAVLAAGADQEARLWRIRDELPIYRLFEHQAIALKNDIAVPVARVPDLLTGIRALVDTLSPGTVTYAFGHVGDGNLHVAVLPDDGDDPASFLAARDELRSGIDDLTWRLGGTLSAEHGIGRDLNARIAAQKPEVEWRLMRALKSALDPGDLFNPGALFPNAADRSGTT